MAKLTLTDISAGYDTVSLSSANNTLIESALENTLSRDGTAPNQMESALDMNSYRITNLPNAVGNQDPLTLSQASTLASISTAFTQENVGAVLYPRTAAETSAAITPTNYYYKPGDVRRYGAVGDGVTDDYQAFADAIAANKRVIAKDPPTRWVIGSTLTWPRSYQNIEIFGDVEYTGTADTGLFKVQGGHVRHQIECHGLVYGNGTNYCVHYEWGINGRVRFNMCDKFKYIFPFIQAVGGQTAGHSLVENIIEYQLLYGGSTPSGTTAVLFRNTTGDSPIPCEGVQLMGGFIANFDEYCIRVEDNTNSKYLYVEGSLDTFGGIEEYSNVSSSNSNAYLNIKWISNTGFTLGDGDVMWQMQSCTLIINSETLAAQCFDLKAENGPAQPVTGHKYIGSMKGGSDGTESYTTILAGSGESLSSSHAVNLQAYYKPGTTATPASTEAKEAGLLATFRRNDDASAIKGGTAEFQKRVSLDTVDFVVGLANAASHGDKFIIKGDGGIGVSNTVANTNTPSGATSDAMPIYDETGALVGYIPIYASQW